MMSLKTTFAVYPKEPTEFFKSHTSELCNLMKRIELTSGISAHIIFFYRLNFYRLNLIPWQLAAGSWQTTKHQQQLATTKHHLFSHRRSATVSLEFYPL